MGIAKSKETKLHKLHELVTKTTLKDVFAAEKPHLVTASRADTVQHILKDLHQHGIHAVPLVNTEADASKEIEEVSDLDMVTFFSYLVGQDRATAGGSYRLTVDKLEDLKARFFSASVSAVKSTPNSKVHTVVKKESATLMEVIEALRTRSDRRAYRVVVTSDDGSKVVSVFTQSMLTGWMYKHFELLQGVFAEKKKTAIYNVNATQTAAESDLRLIWKTRTKQVVVAEEQLLAGEAFEKMVAAGVRSLPVVNTAGELIANISASDFNTINQDNFNTLGLPVVEYLKMNSKYRDIISAPSLKFLDMMETMVTRNVHHLYVIDDKKPVDCVSLSDILNTFYDNIHALD